MLAPMVLAFILPFPHTVALRLGCLFISFGTAVYLWRRLDVPPLPFKVPIALWALVSCISLAYAVDPAYTLGEIKNEIFYSMLAFVAAFALTRDAQRLKLLCLAVAVALVAIAVAAAVGVVWFERAPEVWYTRGPPATNYLVMAVPVAGLGLYLWKPHRIVPALLVLAVLLVGLAILAGQRAVWVVLAAQSLVACAWLVRKGILGGEPRRSTVIALVALVIPAAGLYATEKFRTTIEPYAAMEKDLRLEVWKEIVERIAEKPLSGAGHGREVLRKAYPDLIPEENPLFWHAHNVVLNYGVSEGVPGMIAILLLFGAIGWRFWSISASADPTLRAVGLAGALVVTGAFTRNMFNDYFVREGALFFWFLGGAMLGVSLRATRSPVPG